MVGVYLDSSGNQHGFILNACFADFNSAVEDGNLVGYGPGNSAKGRLKAFGNMLHKAQVSIDAENYEMACGQLKAAYKKCDGISPPQDFVSGSAREDFALYIECLMNYIGCE